MNESSFDYLKNQLFYLGFGEEIAQPLRTKMEQNLAEFTLPHTRKFGQDEAHSVLHFSKGDQLDKDMTFFNRFDLTLKQPGKEDLTQTFFVGNERKFNHTLQERYNMMDGRAVYREQPVLKSKEENGETKLKPTGETYIAWKQLDFKTSDGTGNFLAKTMFWDHVKELGQYPIKGIADNYDKQRIVKHIEKGNKADVILLRNGQETPVKVAANPRMARLEFYDRNGQSLVVRKVEKQVLGQSEKAEMTPQEVQKAAIARAAEQSQQKGESQKPGEAQKNEAKQTVADELKNGQSQGHRRGVRV